MKNTAEDEFNMQIAAATALATQDGVPRQRVVEVLTLIALAVGMQLEKPSVPLLRKLGRDFDLVADRIDALPPTKMEPTP